MRLLNVHTLKFHDFLVDIPRYAIASHRWIGDTEVTLEEVSQNLNLSKAGHAKVRGFADYVKSHLKHVVEWIWIDTCCINKKSDAELTEAINSMFKWYREAEVCLAYLSDVDESGTVQSVAVESGRTESGTAKDVVEATGNLDGFTKSEWFRRGWTLQELLAPRTVIFLTKTWETLGYKGPTGRSKSGVTLTCGPSLNAAIVAASGVPEAVLNDCGRINEFEIDERLEWIGKRRTTREEDMSYCLLGLLDLTMPIIYGEGAERARERLLRKAGKKHKRETGIALSSAQGVSPKAGSNVPFRRDPDFVDRETIMADVRTMLSRPAGRAALVGLGGTGKSQLAIEYAYRIREQSPKTWVFWIHASNDARFKQGIRAIADLVGIDTANSDTSRTMTLVRDWLHKGSEKWVVVLDNADDASFLVNPQNSRLRIKGDQQSRTLIEYLPICDLGSILITTRTEDAALKLVEHAEMITVDHMTESDAVVLLMNKLKDRAQDEDCISLAKALDFMPLAITQAASYIIEMGGRCSVQQYVEKIQRSDSSNQSILDYDGGDLRRDSTARNSIMLTWQISFEHINKSRQSAAELLSLMSLCDGHGIPEKLIRRRFSISVRTRRPGPLIDVQKTLPTGQNESARSDSEQCAIGISKLSMEEEFEIDLMTLKRYKCITVTSDPSVFEMHGLVQLATRKWLEIHGQLERWEEQYIENLKAIIPTNTSDVNNWTEYRTLFPHVMAARLVEPKSQKCQCDWANVMLEGGWFALRTMSPRIAEDFAMRCVEKLPRTLDHIDFLTLLAGAKHENGKFEEAEQLQLQSVEISKKLYGEKHAKTLKQMYNLSKTYKRQGRMDEFEELNKAVFKIGTDVLGQKDKRVIKSMSNLAIISATRGDLEEARQMQERVCESLKDLFGDRHPDTLISMAKVVDVYYKQERYNEAEELCQRVLGVRKEIQGDSHRDMISIMGNLARIWWAQGKSEAACDLMDECVALYSKVMGSEHWRTMVYAKRLAKWKESMAQAAQR